ncbi:MAG: hypothetical protein M0C28_06155 [Candidatus Moduliflexus flocculans]|nr:hypothetical protein [Candidatus Moduliflexus flocculans]
MTPSSAGATIRYTIDGGTLLDGWRRVCGALPGLYTTLAAVEGLGLWVELLPPAPR